LKPKTEAMKDMLNVKRHRVSVELIGYAGEESVVLLGHREPIRQNEFIAAGQNGIRPAMMLVVRTNQYNGRNKAKIGDEVYTIYRTYERDDGKTELYCEVRLGGS